MDKQHELAGLFEGAVLRGKGELNLGVGLRRWVDDLALGVLDNWLAIVIAAPHLRFVGKQLLEEDLGGGGVVAEGADRFGAVRGGWVGLATAEAATEGAREPALVFGIRVGVNGEVIVRGGRLVALQDGFRGTDEGWGLVGGRGGGRGRLGGRGGGWGG